MKQALLDLYESTQTVQWPRKPTLHSRGNKPALRIRHIRLRRCENGLEATVSQRFDCRKRTSIVIHPIILLTDNLILRLRGKRKCNTVRNTRRPKKSLAIFRHIIRRGVLLYADAEG